MQLVAQYFTIDWDVKGRTRKMKLVLEYCFAHIYPLVIHSIYKLSRNAF